MNASRRHLGLLLGAVAVAVVLAAVGTAIADSDSDDTLGMGLLDPFSLTTLGAAPAGSGTAFLSGSRPPVRIPFRPALRSPFRPPLILR